jgi:cysteine-rich repeat protein
MRNFGLALGLFIGLSTACAPASTDLDLATSVPHDGRDGSDERESGIRILSDVTPPGQTDGSRGHGGATGADARDATTADTLADGSLVDDAPTLNDVASDRGAGADAKGADAAVVSSDAALDSVRDTRTARPDGAYPDAEDAADVADAAGVHDAPDGETEAGIVLGTCTAVRQCVRSGLETEAGCLRSASDAARSTSEPVLACETAACAAPCRTVYRLGDCNACLLSICPAAIGACARQSGCGNGVVATDTEECDDGNADDRDACTAACSRARCGDGRVYDGQEACDDGNRVDTDECLTSCRKAACGDRIVWNGVEGCDDGNQTGGDGCSATCLIESCGNGIVDPGEECDEGVANREEAPCLPTCRVNRCGDGKTCRGDGCGARLSTTLEQCDDGNDVNSDACVKTCRSAVCGDGYVRDGVETCDDGNGDPFDGCGRCFPPAGHLLITEVVTRPAGAELIEIVNPTPFPIALSDYLLSDSHVYYEVATGTFTTASGTDFAARFPDGAVLEPGRYAVVALGNASGGSQSFAATYGKAPDFELRPTANQASDDTTVPNMVAAGSSIGASASLTDGGEPVVLFSYRGGDLVSDVDYLFYGAPSASNPMIDKTGVVAGASTYLVDTPASAQHATAAPGEAGSIHRCVYAESHETSAHGNGIAGHDETSEDVAAAFAIGATTDARTPGGPPPSGLCP